MALLGLVGTPSTTVFVGKFTTATAGWDGGYGWLALVVFLNSVLSLFYYLRWIVPTYRGAEPTGSDEESAPTAGDEPARPWSRRLAVTAAALSLLAGRAAGALWGVAAGS